MIPPRSLHAALSLSLVLAACGGERTEETSSAAGSGPGGAIAATPGNLADAAPFAGIAAGETIHFTGNEPFWGGSSSGGELTYATPENIDGTAIAVERFAGRNGLSLSGALDGAPFDMAITPGECSDGMSDRTYPFVVTLEVAGAQRRGCAWTDSTPFSGPEHP